MYTREVSVTYSNCKNGHRVGSAIRVRIVYTRHLHEGLNLTNYRSDRESHRPDVTLRSMLLLPCYMGSYAHYGS